MKTNRIFFLSVLSGILLGIVFSKFNFYYLVWIALIPYFIALISSKNYKESALIGFWFGFVYFLIVLYWIISLYQWGGFWVYVGWILLSVFQTFYIILFSVLSHFVIKRFNLGFYSTIILAVIWSIFEILRCRGEFASCAGILGYSQYRNILLIQISSIFRVYGISFIIVFFNILISEILFSIFTKKKAAIKALLFVTIFFVLMLSLVFIFGFFRIKNLQDKNIKPFKIAIIQPNFNQNFKLNPSNSAYMLDRLISMSEKAIQSNNVSMVVWPETAVMDYPVQNGIIFNRIKKFLIKNNVYLLTGGFYYEDGKYYNSAFLFSPNGELLSRYDKEHLMPFGEYLPFGRFFYPLLKNTGFFEIQQSSNPNPQILKTKDLKIGCMICFESLFDNLAKNRGQKSDFLLAITNDAWFGNTSAPDYHIMAGPFRAIENGIWFVQCANNGISAVIDNFGRFVYRSNLGEVASPTITIYLYLNNAKQ